MEAPVNIQHPLHSPQHHVQQAVDTMDALASMAWPGMQPDWSNLNVLHTNTEPARAHFYSYPDEDSALTFDREQGMFHSLNGTWKFHYDASPYEAPLWETANTTDWDDIEVPGMWQMQGYGHPHYTNIQWPFPVDSPNISYINPTGSYWREFEVPEDWDEDQQIRLRYEGVDSAFHVWVNGDEVGYSQGARNPSEFDITDYLKPGKKNTLATRVYQWSDGSYIEDQDQWWLSGIFRDVYLIPFQKSAIIDYSVVPDVDDSFKSGTLKANVTTQGKDGDMTIKLLSPEGKKIDVWKGKSSERYEKEVKGDDFLLWSAETPNLYTMLITFNDRTISQKVGFRRVEMKDANFLVNGQPITIFGTNRHEHYYKSGRTVPYEIMRADLIRMKQSNLNAIRTSHYPPHPSFFDVADELGFYLIAEADLECHGFGMVADDDEGAASWASDNPIWHDAYLDRAEQLVERYKNHVAIIFWSLGNECFFGRNHEAMAKWIKQKDPSRLIHYEPDRNATVVDVYSQMYSDLETLKEHIGNHTEKPLILCEFIHSMGNGPGGIIDYVELIRSEKLLQGGFVWEWNNHGLIKKENGTEFFAYGGDFGDEPNDADFCMDGMTLSDHTPMPSLKEYAKNIQPVSVNLTEDSSKMVITNHYDFLDLSGLSATWHVVQDGKKTDAKDLKIPKIPAGESRTVELPVDSKDFSDEAWVTLEFALKEDKAWADKGHVVAWDQLYFPGSSKESRSVAKRDLEVRKAGLKVSQDRSNLTVKNGDSTFGFDLLKGNVTWNTKGTDLLQRGPEISMIRALTENDVAGDGVDWDTAHVPETHTSVKDVTWDQDGDTLTIHYKVRVAPKVLEWALDGDLIYKITAGDSSLSVRASGDFSGKNKPDVVPRIGLMAVLPSSFEEVSWFGRGPGENYKDSKQGSPMGEYESSVKELWQHYDWPQENGNREDLRWVRLGNGDVTLDARRTDGHNEPFSFNARHWMPEDLNAALHPFDLDNRAPLDITVLNLDYDQNGLGSATCGPRPFQQYLCKTEAFDFTFELSIV